MSSESPGRHPGRLSRVFKWSGIVLVILLVLLGILVAMLPTIGNMGIVYWLEKQGVQARIERIEIDFNDASITVSEAQGRNQQGRGFGLARFYIDLAWQPLTESVVRIERLELSGLTLDSLQDVEGLRSVAGLDLSKLAGDDARAAVQENATTSSHAKPWRLELNRLQLEDINLCHGMPDDGRRYCLKLDAFDWNGQLAYDPAQTSDRQMIMDGDLNLGPVSFEETQQAVKILSLEKFALVSLSMEGIDHIALENTRLEGLSLFPVRTALEADQIVHLDSLQLDQTVFDKRHLSIKQITLSGIGASLYRSDAGDLEISHFIDRIRPETRATEKTSVAQAEGESTPLEIQIDTLAVVDSHPIVFVDKSLGTPFDIKAEIRALKIRNIDTARPDQPSDLHMHIVTDNHGSIELNGSIQLMAPTRSFDISGQISGLDLRPVGSYIESGLGHRIRSGQLNAQVKLQASEGQLDSTLDLDLKHFELKKTPGAQEEIDKDIGLPLGTALNLLRDRDNSIRLTIPVTGDVSRPEFDPSDAVRKATSKAITSAVISYYTPFGLVTAVEGLYNLATALRFEPVEFAPGVAALNSDHRDALNKLVKLMHERPELHLSLCGFSNADDARAMRPELAKALDQPEPKPAAQLIEDMNRLADTRAAVVKTYLVEQKTAADRLILCEGEFNVDGLAGVQIDL